MQNDGPLFASDDQPLDQVTHDRNGMQVVQGITLSQYRHRITTRLVPIELHHLPHFCEILLSHEEERKLPDTLTFDMSSGIYVSKVKA